MIDCIIVLRAIWLKENAIVGNVIEPESTDWIQGLMQYPYFSSSQPAPTQARVI